jgi:SP family sugar:H+ symporter-like MFS transporter
MEDFLQRFGESDGQGGYSFSHVREGLIVAMLSIGTLIGAHIPPSSTCTTDSKAL